MKIDLHRIDDAFHMQAINEDGLTAEIDGSPTIGGGNKALRPMQMLLASVGGCSSIDVIHLLRKQRQEIKDIKISVEGTRVENKIPAVFKKIHLHYQLFGDLDDQKVERACRLSMEKLCSVSIMLKPSVEITWSYEVVRNEA
ncbi:MAG: hypothetical protein DHS20C18_23190 [Saprospiraceae bacterium]|nr:MAG: hypothetical protein DHS20C18_23190 [Saprospiraceae bacterium]